MVSMDMNLLTRLGLTRAESQVYIAMVPMGRTTVSEIAKRTGFHRTNIYDVLEQLKEKGLVTFFKEAKTTFYKASDPDSFYAFVKQMELDVETIVPEIKRLSAQENEDVEVQIYKGRKGMKIAFMNMARNTGIIYAFGVRGQLRQYMPEFYLPYIRETEKRKVRYMAIYTEFFQAPPKYSEIRYVPKELGNPVATFLYNNTVFINIWDPVMLAIVIKSKGVYESYLRHFRLLWKIAKKH